MISEFKGFEVIRRFEKLSQIYYIIESDEMRLKQVIMNLLSNALKFTRRDGQIKITTTLIQSLDK